MEGYTIIREIGKGGMGCVYEAQDRQGNRIALKMMNAKAASHPDYREMFEYEVQSLKKLSHPSIVKIVSEPFSDSSGNIYLPMEFIEGKTISQIVQESGPYNETEALDLFSKILDAFTYIHGMSCIHRDVKPSNIMIRPDGRVCVIDFGIAKDSKTNTGKTIGRVVGTDGYMSPEQANGYNIDSRTDIYSLGCLLHYMLCGTHAITKQSNDYDTICAILENKFPLASERGISISDRTQTAILTAVNKNMTLRFQTALEFKEALKNNVICCISVGRSNCAINMPGEYVSAHHLDVIWERYRGEYKVTIKDHSTNGTGVNGRKIKNESYSFNTGILPWIKGAKEEYPQVLISGLPDYMLDWDAVGNVLYNVMDMPTSVYIDEGVDDVKMDLPKVILTKQNDELTLFYGILSFVIPIAGWVIWGVCKEEYPSKAKMANRLAWGGVVFNLISMLIMLVS